MKSERFSMLLGAALILTFAACGPPPGPSTRVERINPNAQVDMSGNWNDTDANLVARAMIQDCLGRPWAGEWKGQTGQRPVIRLSRIRNRSAEHINTRFYTKQVEAELLNSGLVRVVADREEAWDNREERADQAEHASDETVKSQGQETGSDFILNGWVETQNDAIDGQEVRAYITTMELINSKTNEKVWMKVHPIKKIVSRDATQW